MLYACFIQHPGCPSRLSSALQPEVAIICRPNLTIDGTSRVLPIFERMGCVIHAIKWEFLENQIFLLAVLEGVFL
jgi:hypothetical protein